MNVSDHVDRVREKASRHGSARANAVESAESIAQSSEFVPGGLSTRTVTIAIGVLAVGIALVAANFYGVPAGPDLLVQSITTENGLTAYSAVAGIGGFIGTAIASTRLSTVDADTIALGSLTAPIIVTFLGNVIAGFLFPAGSSTSAL